MTLTLSSENEATRQTRCAIFYFDSLDTNDDCSFVREFLFSRFLMKREVLLTLDQICFTHLLIQTRWWERKKLIICRDLILLMGLCMWEMQEDLLFKIQMHHHPPPFTFLKKILRSQRKHLIQRHWNSRDWRHVLSSRGLPSLALSLFSLTFTNSRRSLLFNNWGKNV